MSQYQLAFPESSTVDAVEGLLLAAQRENDCMRAADLHLDFSGTEFFDVPALLHLVSMLTQRRRAALRTLISLPRSKNARDFLRIWNFDEAIKNASGATLGEVFRGSDVAFFSTDLQRAVMRYSIARRYDGSLQRLLSRRFFSIFSFFAKRSEAKSRTALNESDRWQEALILAVLDRHLGHPDD
jgi:hypothetical protein